VTGAAARFSVAVSDDLVVVTFESAPGEQVMRSDEVELADVVAKAIFDYLGTGFTGRDPIVESATGRERAYRPRRVRR
jgi:hypothetical protein